MARARKLAPKFNRHNYTKLAREAIRAFDTMPLVGEGTKPRVGVVGEILVKFHPTANNHVSMSLSARAARQWCRACSTSSCTP